MLKKTITTLIIFASSLFAQDLTDVRIYINPGHGGFDSNDRFIPETGFWESVSNLDKGLFLRDMLLDLNATIQMSRTTNFSSDDLPLSVIAAQANQFNADYFQSIHSNAFNSATNYTLLLFRGYDNSPVFPEAKIMGNIMANKIYQAHRTTNNYNRGDWTFYGSTSGLGVLRTLSMPGTLSEGSFHDYIPESWRLMNMEYKKHEAYAVASSFLQYFNQPGFATGFIAGVVRDPDQNVSYYAIPTTNDGKKPLNNIKITLTPGDIVYNGDSNNNGFFLFDSLAPGTYKLYYEVQNYNFDSATVNVTANQTVFADKNLQFDTTIPPEVVYHFPLDDPDSVNSTTNIEIEFSRQMDQASVESSFSITPNADGVLSWESDRKLVFDPDLPLEKATRYTVSVSTGAQSIWNVPLTDAYTFEFTTVNRNRFNIASSYPAESETGISQSVQIRIEFDAPIQQSTLTGNVALFDETGQQQFVKNVSVFEDGGKGYLFFEPKNFLQRNVGYRLELGGGIKDINEYPLLDDITINFRTQTEALVSGSVLNNFEVLDDWKDPEINPLTSGINNDNTLFQRSGRQKISGSWSGLIEYEFSAPDGSIVIENTSSPVIGTSGSNQFGIWVFGDLSGNELKYSFSDSQSSLTEAVIDTIDWTGWKLKYITLSELPINGEIKFNAIIINKIDGSSSTGNIYFDDMQTDIITGINEEKSETVIKDYSLAQNYPNPFNPSTKINYSIPKEGKVVLEIYDILGSKIKTLVNEFKSPGNYNIDFDARELASGIYFYKLSVNDFQNVRKMLLLK